MSDEMKNVHVTKSQFIGTVDQLAERVKQLEADNARLKEARDWQKAIGRSSEDIYNENIKLRAENKKLKKLDENVKQKLAELNAKNFVSNYEYENMRLLESLLND